MKKNNYIFMLIVITSLVVISYMNITTNIALSERCVIINSNNLLTNPHFKLAIDFVKNGCAERNVAGDINFSSELDTIDGAYDGVYAQLITYHGMSKDNGNGKIEVYQNIPIKDVGVKTLNFSVYLNGEVKNTTMAIGIESFDNNETWINETDSYITDISNNKKCYYVVYNCPVNAQSVAVYVQCQEINPQSDIKLLVDNASLVVIPLK